MNYQPVTLVRGQSVNLTTGAVTEGDLPDRKIDFALATSNYPGHLVGLRMNDLESLASLIKINADRGDIAIMDCWGHIHQA